MKVRFLNSIIDTSKITAIYSEEKEDTEIITEESLLRSLFKKSFKKTYTKYSINIIFDNKYPSSIECSSKESMDKNLDELFKLVSKE